MTDDLERVQADLAELREQIENIQMNAQRAVGNLAETLQELQDRFDLMFPPEDPDSVYYRIEASPLFWRLRGEERDEVIADLRQWVGEVYSENFGYVSAKLPDCWTEHNLILTVVDILKELHSVLYLRPRTTARQLMSQADFFTRYLVPLAEMASADAKNCSHARAKLAGSIGGVA